MPLYDYKCEECEYAIRFFHGVDEGAGKCPRCCSAKFNKQFKQSNVVLENTKNTAQTRVEKFIEESREVLKEQMAEARKEIEK